jgi:dUTP pyrophosphatase
MMRVKIKKLHESAVVPKLATDGAACFDVVSMESGTVYAMQRKLFRTGLSFEVPQGFTLMLYSRSGHGMKGIRLANGTGIIDSDYRGEVSVALANDGAFEFHVHAGDRIAQAMILPVPAVEFVLADELTETARGAGGFGSTGA